VIERDLDALVCYLRFPTVHRKGIRSTNLFGADLHRGATTHQGERPLPRRNIDALARLGRARTLLPRLARGHDDTAGSRRDRTAATRARNERRQSDVDDRGGDRSVGSRPSGGTSKRLHPDDGTPPRRYRHASGRQRLAPVQTRHRRVISSDLTSDLAIEDHGAGAKGSNASMSPNARLREPWAAGPSPARGNCRMWRRVRHIRRCDGIVSADSGGHLRSTGSSGNRSMNRRDSRSQ